MQRTQSETLTFSFASFSPKTEFIFTSEHRSLMASGINQTIIQPAIDGDDNNSLFQRAIQRAFLLEKQKGINNPIIIGSIPFDVNQPSCLYVPTAFKFIDRHAFQHATRLFHLHLLRLKCFQLGVFPMNIRLNRLSLK
ncbi:MAG: hypothetical protein V7735_18240 [Photobacterium frigidiphilum]|uniref:hypothetical protein n=1 Tax=Photobacterium frigidiphilum TaxID=264736 RepID=UPI00300356AB